MMLQNLALFFFLAYTASVCDAAGSKIVMESRLENFYQCPERENTQIHFKNMIVKRINARESRLFGDVVINSEFKDMQVKVELFKCASISEPDTCEYYTSIKIASFCDKLSKREKPWIDYWDATTMPKTCPLTKGDYKVNGAKIGMDSSFPLFDGFWKFKNKGIDANKKTVLCFIMEMNIRRRFKL